MKKLRKPLFMKLPEIRSIYKNSPDSSYFWKFSKLPYLLKFPEFTLLIKILRFTIFMKIHWIHLIFENTGNSSYLLMKIILFMKIPEIHPIFENSRNSP